MSTKMLPRRSVSNPEDAPQQNWYCVTLNYEDQYGISDHGYVWFNPHFYFWNVGYGQLVKDCDGSPPAVPNCADIPKRGENVLRSKCFVLLSRPIVQEAHH
eukprot:gb/GECG01001318.1/.p1 GENE.gb/GECG01001318.1/~~gb/GECG01001318.1/.p1  ORF type:complete len:101 (+),score=9.25 gb/GECG01001318.1/:1-303(+)